MTTEEKNELRKNVSKIASHVGIKAELYSLCECPDDVRGYDKEYSGNIRVTLWDLQQALGAKIIPANKIIEHFIDIACTTTSFEALIREYITYVLNNTPKSIEKFLDMMSEQDPDGVRWQELYYDEEMDIDLLDGYGIVNYTFNWGIPEGGK